ncbi:MAG: PfkB family carbohydrate kinase [bacterium]
MATVIGIGEAMVRLSPAAGETLESAAAFTVQVGGAEANVCVALARLGVATAWISRLPANPLGRRIADAVRAAGVDADGIVWAPDGSAGVMFLQPGAAPRAGEIFYYRRQSAFASIDPDAVGWSRLDGARVVHLTGITPALGDRPRDLVVRAIAEARARQLLVSFDVNYRATLWSPSAARETLGPLLNGLDIVLVNERDARGVFEMRGEPDAVARALRDRLRCRVLVLTCGESGAVAADAETVVRQPAVRAEVVDRVGRGDAFAAGFLYGYLARGTGNGLRYGAALAALKQTYSGDFCRATLRDVEAVLRGDDHGLRR